jgi:hypothetical protein
VNVKRRRTITPAWRCIEGHVFDKPMEDAVEVTAYNARYEGTFVDAPDGVPVAGLKAAALRPSDQASIEEIDLARIAPTLIGKYPGVRGILARFLQGRLPDPSDADDSGETEGESFEPSIADRREQVLRSIRHRRGQRRFREQLLRRHGAKCMISGCRLLELVEAAHIWPYRANEDNHPDNGLLLRADLHTLFDLNLPAVEPSTLRVRFHPAVLEHGYAMFEGAQLRLTGNQVRVAKLLQERWASFYERLRAG